MNTIIVTNTADNGAGSLREAIATAQTGDKITFDPSLSNQTITLTSGQIEISAGKNLIIDGGDAANLTLSGNHSSRIFHLDSNQDNISGLTVKNLNITEGYTAEIGGAILTEHLATLTVENVNFSDNIADEGGGAIYVQWEGTLTITNSAFDHNEAIAANDERGAGAITFLSPGELTIIDSDFTNNRGINGGAINSLNGKLTVENSRFINNDTTAAFYDEGNPRPFLRGFGGAIYTDRASSASDDTSGTISITNSLFSGNQGRGEGGAAYLYTGRQDNVVISETLFEDNEVLALDGAPDGTFDGNGGAVVQQSDGLNQGFSVTKTTFANNTAASQGGGLWVMNAPTTITNSTFSGNQTLNQNPRSVGGGLTAYSPTEILQSTFANNHAGWVGGAVAANDSTVTVQSSLFDGNTADNGDNNWGIQQHSNRELTDLGGNFQYPPKATNNGNDYNVTATIETTVNPQLGNLQDNGGSVPTHLVGNPLAVNSGAIFVEKTPVDEIPIEENPVEENPTNEIPIEENPVEEIPVEETPVDENPVDENPTNEIPVHDTCDDDFDLIPEPDITITSIDTEDNINGNQEIVDNQDRVFDVIEGEIEEPEETDNTDIVTDVIDVEIQEEESGKIVAPTLSFQSNNSFTIESNKPVKLAVHLLENNSNKMYEIGVFTVEDEQGTVNSLTTEDEGYLQASLSQNQAKVIFSTLSEFEQPENFEIQRERILEGFNNSDHLVFYMVQSGSTDDVLTGKISEEQVIFGSSFSASESELLQVEQLENGQFILSWNAENNNDNPQIVLNLQITDEEAPIGNRLQGQSQRELIDLRSHTGELEAAFTIHREATFDNQAGLYIVDDEDGTVDGIVPGEAGYANAALARRIDNLELFAQEGQTNTENSLLTGGVILAPYVIADGSVDEFLVQNPNNLPGEDTLAYFAYSGANPDSIDHIRLLGDNSFGFEDSFGGGDMDFNDLVLEINF